MWVAIESNWRIHDVAIFQEIFADFLKNFYFSLKFLNFTSVNVGVVYDMMDNKLLHFHTIFISTGDKTTFTTTRDNIKNAVKCKLQ